MRYRLTGVTILLLCIATAIFPSELLGHSFQSNSDTEQSTFIYDEENAVFNEVPKTTTSVDSLLAIAENINSEDPRKASHAAFQALEIADSLQYRRGIASSYKELAAIYIIFGDYDLALKYLFDSLDMFIDKEDAAEIGHIRNMIATVHVMQENYQQATEFFELAIVQLEEAGILEVKAMSLMNLGVAHYYMEDYDLALEYYMSAREMTETEVDFPRLNMIATTNIGNVYIEMDRFDEAEEYLKRAIEFFDEQNYYINLSGAYLYLAKLYNRSNRYDEALNYAKQGRDLAISIEQSQYTLEGYEMMAEIYANLGDFENAYEQYQHHHESHAEVMDSERASQINKMQIQFEVEQKDQEIELLSNQAALQDAQLSEQKLWRNYLITALVLSTIILLLFYRLYAQKKRANELLNKRQNEIQKQNEQLVQLNEEKNQFLHIAAHDLRSPLSSLVGVADLLEYSDETDSESKESYIQIIKQSTGRMINMIDDLLDVNTIEKGLNGEDFKTIDVLPITKSLAKIYRNRAEAKNITLEKNFENRPLYIKADESHLRSIIENLLSNAIKFTSPGGRVTFKTAKDNNRVIISIQDNGPGISDEDQEKLFNRFSKLSNKPTGNESSTGLGLYIVKCLTDELGGKITFETAVGEGTTFTVSIPVADQKEPISEL